MEKRYKVFYNIFQIPSSIVLYYKLVNQPVVFIQTYKVLLPVCDVFYVGIFITDFSYINIIWLPLLV